MNRKQNARVSGDRLAVRAGRQAVLYRCGAQRAERGPAQAARGGDKLVAAHAGLVPPLAGWRRPSQPGCKGPGPLPRRLAGCYSSTYCWYTANPQADELVLRLPPSMRAAWRGDISSSRFS